MQNKILFLVVMLGADNLECLHCPNLLSKQTRCCSQPSYYYWLHLQHIGAIGVGEGVVGAAAFPS